MIRNLSHALGGVIIILGIGWLVAQPSVQKQISPGGHHAILGVLAALTVFVLISAARAFRGGKKSASRSGASPYAAPAKRK